MEELYSFLKKEELDVKTAISILKKSTQTNPGNYRSLWKMMRFTLYIWQRHKEYKANMLGTKIESIRRVVAMPKYKRLWATHKQTGKFDLVRVKNCSTGTYKNIRYDKLQEMLKNNYNG